ncbi:MAG: universal stress protein [Phormidesmis sp.]
MSPVPFQTIMVGIDTTEVSEAAFDKALVLAKALTAKLLVVHVLSPTDCDRPQLACSYSSTGALMEIGAASYQSDTREWSAYTASYEALLAQKIQSAEDVGVEAESIQTHGISGASLCYLTSRREVDLLVVGSHRRQGLAALSAGSTSHYIINHAPCPVLVVHSDTEGRKQSLLGNAF